MNEPLGTTGEDEDDDDEELNAHGKQPPSSMAKKTAEDGKPQ